MGKSKKRHKNRGKLNKVIVIDGFVNERVLNHYLYILEKYSLEEAASSMDDTIKYDESIPTGS